MELLRVDSTKIFFNKYFLLAQYGNNKQLI